MDTKGKQLVRVNAFQPDLSEIKTIMGKLFERALEMYARRYGDTLDLTRVEVQIDVVSGLSQFYDPPL